jgi:hypothetical protein
MQIRGDDTQMKNPGKKTTKSARAATVLTLLGVFAGLAMTGYTVLAATLKPADFKITATPEDTIYRGQSGTYTITITPLNGFSGSVTLSTSGLPTGATGVFTRNPVTPSNYSSTLIVSVSASAPTGDFEFKFTGVSGSLTHTTAAIHLKIQPLPKESFTLGASPSSVTVAAGSSATYTVSITRTKISDPVALSIGSDLPAGVTASFTPNPAPGNSSSLVLATSSSTPNGTYLFEINGTKGKFETGTTATLVVTSGAQNFTISGNAISLLYPGGAISPINLAFQNPNGVPITVTSVTVTIGGTSVATCGSGNFTMTQQLSGNVVVPAGGSQSLQGAGVPQSQWPKIQMIDTGVNQDACKTATLHLSYSGSAHS